MSDHKETAIPDTEVFLARAQQFLANYEFHVDYHGDRRSLKLTAEQAIEVLRNAIAAVDNGSDD